MTFNHSTIARADGSAGKISLDATCSVPSRASSSTLVRSIVSFYRNCFYFPNSLYAYDNFSLTFMTPAACAIFPQRW